MVSFAVVHCGDDLAVIATYSAFTRCNMSSNLSNRKMDRIVTAIPAGHVFPAFPIPAARLWRVGAPAARGLVRAETRHVDCKPA